MLLNSKKGSGYILLVFEVVDSMNLSLLIVDFQDFLLMLIFSLKLLVDVDRKGKNIVLNSLVDPPMYPP